MQGELFSSVTHSSSQGAYCGVVESALNHRAEGDSGEEMSNAKMCTDSPVVVDESGKIRRTTGDGDTACHSVIVPEKTLKKEQGLRLKVWKGANLMELERVKSPKYEIDEPEKEEEKKKKPKRGKVTGCTKAAMRRMRKDMAKVDASQDARSSCLTYPQQEKHLCPNAKESKKHLQILQKWCDNKFPWLGLYWKREPHKSGITHYHLLYFLNGRSDAEVWEAMKQVLFEWCCITTGSGSGFPAVEHEKQLLWHLDERNYEKVQEGMSFFNYLGKYLSKGSNEVPDGYDNEGGGNWWGRFNKKAIPYVEAVEKTVKIDDKKEKAAVRIFYKLRDKRKQAGFDSLHFTSSNPRVDRDTLARAMWNREYKAKGYSLRSCEKLATKMIFRMEGSRKSLTAPIKVNPSWHFGTVSFMGDPAPLVDCLKRFLIPQIDTEGRKRIFSDNYKPVSKDE